MTFRLLAAARARRAALLAAAPGRARRRCSSICARVQSMTADFTQTDRDGKVLTGTLTLKRPGKIRFQYEKGVPLLIVGDGKALWFIDYSVRQVSAGRSAIRRSACCSIRTRDMTRFARVHAAAAIRA